MIKVFSQMRSWGLAERTEEERFLNMAPEIQANKWLKENEVEVISISAVLHNDGSASIYLYYKEKK